MATSSLGCSVPQPSCLGYPCVPGFYRGIYGGLSNDGADDAKTKLGRAALGLLIAFVVGLVCVVTSTTWLVISQSQPLYDTAVSLFALQVTGLTAATFWTLYGGEQFGFA
jgi:hypothetical protein